MRLKFMIGVLISLVYCGPVWSDPLNIYLVSPTRYEDGFWDTTEDMGRACARDLNINFRVFYNQSRSRQTYFTTFKRALNAEPRPDAVMAIFFRFTGDRVLAAAKEKGVPVFMINTDIPDGEREAIGEARGKFSNFLGHMAPDEMQTGYMLGRFLISKAAEQQPEKTIEIIGISGQTDSPVSIDRARGLRRAAEETGACLHQIVHTDWSRSDAACRTAGLLKRYRNIDAIWYASDLMALEGLDVANKMNRKLAIGGVDWKKEAVRAIQAKHLAASVGGHFTEIAFSLVLVHDYLHGLDFYRELGGRIRTPMNLITGKNIDRYLSFLTEENWDAINFKRFSKVYSPGTSRYDFSLDRLLNN